MKTLHGYEVRPTSSRIKANFFNILGDSILDARFLDLFSGIGGMGIEALSRGAARVVFVEINKKHLVTIAENLRICLFPADSYRLMQGDVFSTMKRIAKQEGMFDIVFADAPYKYQAGTRLLEGIRSSEILNRNGIFIIEHNARKNPQGVEDLVLYRTDRYGDTCLSWFQYAKSR